MILKMNIPVYEVYPNQCSVRIVFRRLSDIIQPVLFLHLMYISVSEQDPRHSMSSSTTVSRRPVSGPEIMNTFATPLRTYTESTFSGFPGPQGIRSSFISCLSHLYRPRNTADHTDAGIHQGRLPSLSQTLRLPLGCTIPSRAMASQTVSSKYFFS